MGSETASQMRVTSTNTPASTRLSPNVVISVPGVLETFGTDYYQRGSNVKPGGEMALLKFEYAGGHLYALDSRPSLTEGARKGESFRVDSPAAAGQPTFFMPGNEYEDIGEATIYVVPAASEPSMFYTIRAE